jgi:schlafen family protein
MTGLAPARFAHMNPKELFKNHTALLFGIPVIIGAVVGVIFLLPVNEFVFYYEDKPAIGEALTYAGDQLWHSLMGRYPVKLIFFAAVGALLGLLSAVSYSSLYRSTLRIKHLSDELEKDLRALISHGESAEVEFKSTFRWDLKESRPNKALEEVIMKTMAGFMNGEGGSLIIGVSDDGEITGLEHDYNILKKKDRDGFEQALTAAVASRLGTDVCQYVHPVFHHTAGKDVCRIIVRPSHRPVYIKEGNDMRFYLRTGVSTRGLNIQEAVDFISTRWKT